MKKSDAQIVEEILNHHDKTLRPRNHTTLRIIKSLLAKPSALSPTIKTWWDNKNH